MGLFDILFGKKENKTKDVITTSVEEHFEVPVEHSGKCTIPGHVDVERNALDVSTSDAIWKAFIAFDVETTGLNPVSDRIVELGAVLFINGHPTEKFSSLVNSGKDISSSASAVSVTAGRI